MSTWAPLKNQTLHFMVSPRKRDKVRPETWNRSFREVRFSPWRRSPAIEGSAVSRNWEGGHPSLQLPQPWGGRDVGAQQIPTMNISEVQQKKTINKSGTGQIKPTVEAKQCFRMDILTVCYTGSRCPCPSHSCPSPSPRCLTSRSRTCQQPLPLAETTGALGYRGLDLTAAVQKWRAQTITYSLPTGICTACLWFYTCRWSSAPAGETHPVTHHLPCRSRGFRSQKIAHLVLLTCVAIHLVHIGRALWAKAKTESRWKISCQKVKSWRARVGLTWLELPVQFSGMSQSFTASLHTTPRNSICSNKIETIHLWWSRQKRAPTIETDAFTQLW